VRPMLSAPISSARWDMDLSPGTEAVPWRAPTGCEVRGCGCWLSVIMGHA
jgi:hypothetical protein